MTQIFLGLHIVPVLAEDRQNIENSFQSERQCPIHLANVIIDLSSLIVI